MPLTGNWTLAALSALALAAVVGSVLLWNRVRSWLRWPARAGLLVLCQLTACAVVAAVANDANQFYGSWSELFGHGAGVSLSRLAGGAEDRKVAAEVRREHRLGKSLIVSVPVPEAGGTRADPALVYLPAAYFEAPYASTRFQVVELFGGFPGTPQVWTNSLKLQQVLDREITSNRAVPFVAVVPTQNYLGGLRDGECINALNGPQVESTLTVNVQQVIDRDFRVGRGAAGWSVMGYSTGGFCALNIAMRHPASYGAAVSMSGYDQPYLDGTTGHLFGTSAARRLSNDPLWRAGHKRPPISVLLAAARQDHTTYRDAQSLAAAIRAPTRVSMLLLPRGAHNQRTWRAMEPVAFDWLSHVVAPSLGAPSLAEGVGAAPYRHGANPAKHDAGRVPGRLTAGRRPDPRSSSP